MEENLKQMLEERKNLETEGKKLAEELTGYTSGKSEADLDSKLESRLKAISEKLEADLEAITETYNENMTTDYTKAGRQRAEVENLKNEYRKNAEEEIKKVRAEIEEQREAIKSKIDEQNKKINDQNEKIDAQNRKIGLELRKMRDALLPEIAALQKELAENNAQVEIAQKEYDEAYAKYNAEKMSLYRNGVFTEPDSSKMDEAKAKLDELTASGKSVEAKLSEKQGRVDNISQFFGTIMVKETSVEDIQKMIFGEEQSKVETAKTEEEIKQEFIDNVKQRNHAAAQKADENRKDVEAEEEKSETIYTKREITSDDIDDIAKNTFDMLTEEQKQEFANQLSNDLKLENAIDNIKKFKEDYGKIFQDLSDDDLALVQNRLQEMSKEEIEKAKNVQPAEPTPQQPVGQNPQQMVNPTPQPLVEEEPKQPVNSVPQPLFEEELKQPVNPAPQQPTKSDIIPKSQTIKDIINSARISSVELDLSKGMFNIDFEANDNKTISLKMKEVNEQYEKLSNIRNSKKEMKAMLKSLNIPYNRNMDPTMVMAISKAAQEYIWGQKNELGIENSFKGRDETSFIASCIKQYSSALKITDKRQVPSMNISYKKSKPRRILNDFNGKTLETALMPYIRKAQKSICTHVDASIDTRTWLQKFTDNVKNIFGNKVKALGAGQVKAEETQHQDGASLTAEEAAKQQEENDVNKARQVELFGQEMVDKTEAALKEARENANSARTIANLNISREEAKVQKSIAQEKDASDREDK